MRAFFIPSAILFVSVDISFYFRRCFFLLSSMPLIVPIGAFFYDYAADM